jgi:DNA-binding transcriptional regulator YdaS (Cro superfamily)
LTRFKPHEIMAVMINTVADLIRTLGGTKAAAGLFGVTPPNVSNWKKAGRFPARFCLPIKELCQARGIEVNRELFGLQLIARTSRVTGHKAPKAVVHSGKASQERSPLGKVKGAARADSQPKAESRRRRAA